MLKKLVGSANFYLVVGMNVVFATDEIKRRIKKLAETETAYSARQYVMIRAARGDYNNLKGFETIQYDYKFFDIVTKFNED